MKDVRTLGRPIDVEIHLYSECKYKGIREAYDNAEIRKYTGVDRWEIWSGPDGKELAKDGWTDDYGEYLVLVLEDESKVVFRNSYCYMFRF